MMNLMVVSIYLDALVLGKPTSGVETFADFHPSYLKIERAKKSKAPLLTDLASALRALYEFIGHGEGIDSTTMDGGEQFGKLDELAHFFRFNEIYEERRYTANDTPKTGPSGEKLVIDWDQVYRIDHGEMTAGPSFEYVKLSD